MTGVETSQALLADYARNGSERAFRELVSAYVNLVYSTALRLVDGDTHFAQDISQVVFTDLALKAPTLPEDVRLAGWLHCHTCFVARKALRRERRRKARERLSVELQAIEDYSEHNVSQLAAVLDEALTNLPAGDRTAVMLRFFEQLDFRSVGRALGSSEDAARMRVSRALEKLGSLLRRRGVMVSAAGLGFILGTKTISAAPAGLGENISAMALTTVAKSSPLLVLVKETCLTKVNLGLLGAAAVIAIVTILTCVLRSDASPQEPSALLAIVEPSESPEELTEIASAAGPPESPAHAPSVIAPTPSPTSEVVPLTTAPARPSPKPVAPVPPVAAPLLASVASPSRAATVAPLTRPTDFRRLEPPLGLRAGVALSQPRVQPPKSNIIIPGIQNRGSGTVTNAQLRLQPSPGAQLNGQGRSNSSAQNVEPARVSSASDGPPLSADSRSYQQVSRDYRAEVRVPQRSRASSVQTPTRSRNRTRGS